MNGGGSIRRRVWRAAAGLVLAALTAGAAERVFLTPRLGALGLCEVARPGGPPRAAFTNRWRRVEVEAGSRRIVHDGVLVYLNGAVRRERNAWSVDPVDWAEGIAFPWIAASLPVRRKNDRVLLDPGHGGRDKGAISSRQVEESRVTMDVARRAAKILRARGVVVAFTRDGDKTLSLGDRIAIARRVKPDAFVSVHVNATGNPAVRGVETFVMTAPGYASTAGTRPDKQAYAGNRQGVLNMRLAHAIQGSLLAYTGAPDRGVKRARFAVLQHATAPAALVEIGFLTNRSDEAALISRAYRDKIAEGVARGILSFLTLNRKPPAAGEQGNKP